ncbi:hypothetical protein [Cellulomonas sp. HZM]|uniref:hypothetical protein n=1 Tax=Cellulomonas sp. HZM TaxID=1454010 RepID=UPI0012DC22D9|nr:hypothetical protein [Cellulomonas sp. HZM]
MASCAYFSVEKGLLSIFNSAGQVVWHGMPDGLPVVDLRLAQDETSAVVLLDPPDGSGRIHNLVSISNAGAILWRGQLPRDEASDAFVSLEMGTDSRVLANTWSGYRLRLNPRSGRIEGQVPTK